MYRNHEPKLTKLSLVLLSIASLFIGNLSDFLSIDSIMYNINMSKGHQGRKHGETRFQAREIARIFATKTATAAILLRLPLKRFCKIKKLISRFFME